MMDTRLESEDLRNKLLISCGVLQPEIDALIDSGVINADAVYLNKFLHMNHKKLRVALKAALNRYRQRNPVVVYGDLCLGFNGGMNCLMDEYGTVNVDGLNCIDCLLGGSGKLLDIDPDHRFFFLTPGFLDFTESLFSGTTAEIRRRFKMLKGIVIVDSLGNMEKYQERIEHFSNQTGLPVLSEKKVGLSGLQNVIEEALLKCSRETQLRPNGFR